MTKNVGLTVILLLFLSLSVTLFPGGGKPETEFPQLSAEVNYADIEKRIEWLNNLIQKGANFHEYYNHPSLEKVKNVPNYECSIDFGSCLASPV
ncbi:MAG: hypothetical protein LBT89_03295 [Planctomycetaceae bacterium]|jgi:hypothetical protein|nr:hypothetical protein [Planctomycetaceae bacterium]